MTTRVYTFSQKEPWKRFREADAEIKVCKKTTWAIVDGRRHLMGATAFHSKLNVVRMHIAHLKRQEKTRRGAPYHVQVANQQMVERYVKEGWNV